MIPIEDYYKYMPQYYSSNDLKKKVFRLIEVDEKNIVTLKYKGKVFKKVFNII